MSIVTMPMPEGGYKDIMDKGDVKGGNGELLPWEKEVATAYGKMLQIIRQKIKISPKRHDSFSPESAPNFKPLR